MFIQQEKENVLGLLKAINEGDGFGYCAELMHFCANSQAMNAVRPVSLWEPEKAKTVMELVLKTEGLAGDIVELGVFRAGGTVLIAEMLRSLKSNRKIYGIDSFEGLPMHEPEDIGADGVVRYPKGMFKKESSFEYSSAAIAMNKLDKYASLIKGYFCDVLPKFTADKKEFSLVIIDPDQYKGTMESLNAFYDYVVPGGYILIDDYNSSFAVGVKKAVSEFLAGKDVAVIDGGLSMAYFQKK